MREENENEDSLDLLLDTLCNAFGGIILITLLIALMSQEAGKLPTQPQNFSTEALLLQHKINNLQDDLDISEAIQAKLKREDAVLGKDDNTQLVRQLEEDSDEREKLKVEIKLAKKSLEDTPEDNSNLAEKLNTMKVARENVLAELEEQVDALQDRIEETEDAADGVAADIAKTDRGKTQKLRLPKEKVRGGKDALWVVVRHGKLYPVYIGPERRTYNKYDFHITVREDADERLHFLKPRPERGITLARQRERENFLRYINSLSKRLEYLAFAVSPNNPSFEAFNLAKELATAKRIGYTWHPFELNQQAIIFSNKGAAAPPPL